MLSLRQRRCVCAGSLDHGGLQLTYFVTNTFPFPTQLKNINFFMISDSLESTLHVITIQFGVLCVTSKQCGYAVTAQKKKGKLWNLILKLLM